MKNLIILLMIGLSAKEAAAQDTLFLMNRNQMVVTILEQQPDFIKYTYYERPDGVKRFINTDEVRLIKYANGTFMELNAVAKEEAKRNEESSPYRSQFTGPRLGFTFIGPGIAADHLTERGKSPFVTQFGWQFETRFFKTEDGLSGLVEFVPLVGGLEQGLFLPSASLLVGMRSERKNCFEFGVGPNLSLTGFGLVIAAGTSFKSGHVYFPLNIAVVPSISNYKSEMNSRGQYEKVRTQTGLRVSVTLGFNARKPAPKAPRS